jgi:transcriptional regulator with XRE-family HTH domain
MLEVMQFVLDRGELSQDELAALLKVNKSTISRWLTGKRAIHPDIYADLWQLARLVGTARAEGRDVREALRGWEPTADLTKSGVRPRLQFEKLPEEFLTLVEKARAEGFLSTYERALMHHIKTFLEPCEDAASLRAMLKNALTAVELFDMYLAVQYMEDLAHGRH